MNLYIAIPLALLTSLIAASGIAAVVCGWIPPWGRRYVRRPRLYGSGQLIVAASLSWHWIFVVLIDNPWSHQWGSLTGSVILLIGLLVTWIGQSSGGSQRNGARRG
ncbi:hypothetical protein ACIP98_21030 [Streptomyces sp. NPDC088354]|uniref:hypothetical protein n=1 Tax=Streptomyces sp. NPDC088354 TaxID=3365856 RepID=UPI0038092912